MTEAIKTYVGANHPVKDCFLTLELLIDDIDTADTDEPYDVAGAVTSLNIVIDTLEREEKESERLREIIAEALVQAEGCWANHYGDNPEGGPAPQHIQRMREVLR